MKLNSIKQFEALIENGVELSHSEMQHYKKLLATTRWKRIHPNGKKRTETLPYLHAIRTILDNLIEIAEEDEQN